MSCYSFTLNEQKGHKQEPTNACRPLQHCLDVVREPLAIIKSGENSGDPPLELEFVSLLTPLRVTSISNFSLNEKESTSMLAAHHHSTRAL
jgi:hypothetical protein